MNLGSGGAAAKTANWLWGRARERFISLTVRNYRLFFAGQLFSVIGTWVQRTTMSWFVYRLTNSAFLLGLIAFLSMIPSLFVSPFAGAWADHWDRRKTLILTQSLFMLQAGLLAAGVLSGYINSARWWPLIPLATMQGIVEGLDAPFRQNFVLDLVSRRSLLPNAIATNSAMFNSARLVGPSIGGAMIVAFGEGICFLINAVSYLAVIASLLAIRISYPALKPSGAPILTKIKEGWKYSWRSLPIRYLIANLGVFMLFAMSYGSIIPVFARDVLKGNAGTQGLLLTFAGIGALTSAFYMAGRKTIKGLPYVTAVMGGVASLALIGLALSRSVPLSLICMVFIGMGMTIMMSATNTILQSVADPGMRGRVLSVYTMSFHSIMPFGSLLIGSLTKQLGPQIALSITAGVCLLWSLNALRKIPSLMNHILRMLVKNNNTEIYRPLKVTVEYPGVEG
ncbi:MAG: MFS transporter [Candidatus Cloacimonetes bacterium]|nr:MFS transporter [Candidatus Cloacimonadota bacterium]